MPATPVNMPGSAPGSLKKPKRSRGEYIREKIRAAVILERIERNALGELDPPMSSQQIRSAEIVLKKTIPDLQSIIHRGDPNEPVRVITRVENVIVDPGQRGSDVEDDSTPDSAGVSPAAGSGAL